MSSFRVIYLQTKLQTEVPVLVRSTGYWSLCITNYPHFPFSYICYIVGRYSICKIRYNKIMSPIHLEIIQDDPTSAPRLSRVMPAVLYKYVPESSYVEFCNNIDALLSLADTDYRCRARQSSWWSFGVMFWIYWVFFMFIQVVAHKDDASELSDRFYRFLIVCFAICVLHLGAIRIWMCRPTGVPPAADTVSEIRAECEAMTNRTPCASFHLITSTSSMIILRQYMNKTPIERIEVNVAAVGYEYEVSSDRILQNEAHISNRNTSSGVPHSAVHSESAVTSDYRQLDVV